MFLLMVGPCTILPTKLTPWGAREQGPEQRMDFPSLGLKAFKCFSLPLKRQSDTLKYIYCRPENSSEW